MSWRPEPTPPLGSKCWSRREAGKSRNAGGVPFSTLRCRVPGPCSGGAPGTPGRAFAPGAHHRPAHLVRGPGGRRHQPRAQAPRADREPAPPPQGERRRGRHLALTSRGLRPLAPLPSFPGGAPANGGAGAGRADGNPRETKGFGRSCGRAGLQRPFRRPRAPTGMERQPAPPPRLQGLLRGKAEPTLKPEAASPHKLASSTWRPSVSSPVLRPLPRPSSHFMGTCQRKAAASGGLGRVRNQRIRGHR